MNGDELSKVMEEAESCLIEGSIPQAAEAFFEVERVFAKLAYGLPREQIIALHESYTQLKESIILSAEQKTDQFFIREKLKQIEKERQRDRTITNAYRK
jgi:hypothetical protein